MEYAEAVELCAQLQRFIKDDKNIFVRQSKTGHNFGVGIRRVTIEHDLFFNLRWFTESNSKKITVGAVDREKCPEDIFVPVVGQWHQESLIAIIY